MSYSKDLYQKVILDHNRKPRNYRTLEGASHSCPGNNPLCGDQITVYLKVNGEKVEDIAFDGSGCAISRASASLMTEAVKGKTVAEARQLVEQFHGMLTGGLDPEKDEHCLGKLVIFKSVGDYSARVKCASLGWHTLLCALEDKGSVSTETKEDLEKKDEMGEDYWIR
ncbi:MAG: SUF system NifU family Fe-S cluster assembly protein [Planctomycetes bacterium]|nr:SUF system NifU family Fe-S cluster assembly protein [Planctomycetota bacterium]